MKIKLDALRAAIKAADDNSAGSLVDRRATLITEGQKVLAELKSLDDPEATDPEAIEAAKAGVDALTRLDATIEKATKSAEALRRIGGGGGGGATDTGVRLNLKSAALTRGLSTKMASGDTLGQKAVAASGDVIVGTPLDNQIYELGKVGTSALDVLPVRSRPVIYQYLRQVTRENNAAEVAVGQLKPTSKYTVTNVESRLRVIAHLSEPLDSYWISDNAALDTFVANELQYGLQLAVEDAVINGTGEGEGILGILNTSGLQSVAFTVDATTSVRRALTGIESVGFRATSIILNPTDWEGIELSRRQDGTPDLGSALPVVRADTKLWGLNVAVSNAVPEGTAIVFDPTALSVAVDAGVRVQWSESVGDDFARNQLRARCEGRFNVDVFKPMAVAKVALKAA